MEFKGTKGPWQTSHRKRKDGMYSTEVYCSKGETVASISWYPKLKENGVIGTYRGTNALLISKAPCFYEDALNDLELFNELLKALPLGLQHLTNAIKERKKEKEQLIKQATEL